MPLTHPLHARRVHHKRLRVVLRCGRPGRTCRRDACATRAIESGLFCSAAVPAALAGETPALQGTPQVGRLRSKEDDRNIMRMARRASWRGPCAAKQTDAGVCSSRGSLPAPSAHHNQHRRPFSTPTSRKVAAGPARRAFPRAGGRGVGAGKMKFEGVGPLECRPPARQRRAALEADGSDESLLSEETSASNAWPRSKTADGGRFGDGNGNGNGDENKKRALGGRVCWCSWNPN